MYPLKLSLSRTGTNLYRFVVLDNFWVSSLRIWLRILFSVTNPFSSTLVHLCLVAISPIRGFIGEIRTLRLTPTTGQLCLPKVFFLTITIHNCLIIYYRRLCDLFDWLIGYFQYGTITICFVMFDKSFRISLDFLKEQTFDDGTDNEDTMKCEFSYPSYSQSEDSSQDCGEEFDGQYEHEGVVVREYEELQYDKSTDASCATIMRQEMSMKRQAPPVYGRSTMMMILAGRSTHSRRCYFECDNYWIREIISLRSQFGNCMVTWIGRRLIHVNDVYSRIRSISYDSIMDVSIPNFLVTLIQKDLTFD